MNKFFDTSLLASGCVATPEKTALNPKHSYENVKSQEFFPISIHLYYIYPFKGTT